MSRVLLAALLTAGLMFGLATPAHADQTVTVSSVTDGDTFTIAGGQKVRVLGIDSCEMNTAGGIDAKETAEMWLGDGAQVTLAAQPGAPDKDRYGRLLRYVHTRNGSDLGELMVSFAHTGVYAGRNDASPEYVAKLRTLDAGGRNCADAPVPAETRYVPVPGGGDNHHRRGNSRWCPTRWC